MVHEKIPDNHYFIYQQYNQENTDFNHRLSLYKPFAKNIRNTGKFPAYATQIIAILPNCTTRFNSLRKFFNGYQITRATSPLDHNSIWLEIYPSAVHKGSSAAWLCKHLNLDPERTVGIGNDFNDIELLDFTQFSFILENGPAELHNRYNVSSSNDDHGFSNAVRSAQHQLTTTAQ